MSLSITAYVIAVLVAFVPPILKRRERRTAKETGALPEFERASASATDND
ncbi:hypothetical protein [Arthrobacter sp. 92]|nr:hypothetical protein AHiyo6_12680 [Arthrobacter sp. Hiyo6]